MPSSQLQDAFQGFVPYKLKPNHAKISRRYEYHQKYKFTVLRAYFSVFNFSAAFKLN